MNNYSIKIHKMYHYGGCYYGWEKEFVLPFVPTKDIELYENNEDTDLITSFEENRYRSVNISFNTNNAERYFVVNIRQVLPNRYDPTNIDYDLKIHKEFGWERSDTTDIDELKELISREIKYKS